MCFSLSFTQNVIRNVIEPNLPKWMGFWGKPVTRNKQKPTICRRTKFLRFIFNPASFMHRSYACGLVWRRSKESKPPESSPSHPIFNPKQKAAFQRSRCGNELRIENWISIRRQAIRSRGTLLIKCGGNSRLKEWHGRYGLGLLLSSSKFSTNNKI